ncbi:MetQ/NlpA family lipoprotein, partial [Enterobacter hormaechei]|nr:MetQ/NlpA family lipoprotein [Enterobacter hormaechei]
MKLRLGALLLTGLLLAGCDQGGNDARHLKVGVINGAEQDVAEVAKKVAKEKYGLDVELVGFSGSLLPNDATNQGELDANVFQHRPFLAEDNKAHGYRLVAVANTFVFPMAGYSRKIKAVSELKDGATIAIPNDPTNLGRALLLLQKEKLVTLKPDVGLLPTALDITANPKNLQ